MQLNFSPLIGVAARGRVVLAGAALAVALGLSGCKTEMDVAPSTDTAYYPAAVGNSWTYAVVDTVWSQASAVGTQVTPSVAAVTAYKFRETITERFADASGKQAYRLVRAKMVPPSTAWVDDSVFVLTASDRFVALSRSNTRTVELVFPVREDGSWNLNAFNNNAGDTLTNQTRQYSRIGQPYTTGGGPTGLAAKSYATTLTTTNTGTAAADNALYLIGYQQVFAKGVGPVFRRRFYFHNFYLNTTGLATYVSGSFLKAETRHETLIDYVVK
jgi:hypothetical protein